MKNLAQNELIRLCKEMKATAKNHIYDPLQARQGIMVDKACHQLLLIENQQVEVVLSLNSYQMQPHYFWQLSISMPVGVKGIVTDRLKNKVLSGFDEEFTEFTDDLPLEIRNANGEGRSRQFLAFYHE